MYVTRGYVIDMLGGVGWVHSKKIFFYMNVTQGYIMDMWVGSGPLEIFHSSKNERYTYKIFFEKKSLGEKIEK